MTISMNDTIKNDEKMNIYLIYGHDENEVLVQHIKRDLEARGYDVWFDKNPEKEKGIAIGVLRLVLKERYTLVTDLWDILSMQSEMSLPVSMKTREIIILIYRPSSIKPPPDAGLGISAADPVSMIPLYTMAT